MSDGMLMHASNQWSNRPADQRFSSLAEIHAATTRYREIAVEAPKTDVRALRVETSIDATPEPVLIGASGRPARFTHHSFGQLCRKVEAPAAYLRELPAPLAVENLRHGIAKFASDEPTTKLLLAQNGGLTVRAMTGDGYTRIWNSDITSRLIRLTEQSPEWQPAPAAFDGSRGLYASDEDMFCFLVDNDRRIFEKGPGGGLGRGFFVWNSEVGGTSFGVMTFYYEYICGNHRVWGTKGVAELRIPHVGNADARAFSRLNVELRRYADSSASADEAKVASMQSMEIGGTKDDVLDKIFGLRLPAVTLKIATRAYELAEQREDWYGNPRSVWGFTGALTEIARDLPNANDRVQLDKSAGKIMQTAF